MDATNHYNRNSHEFEKPPTFLVVLFCNLYRPPRESVHLLHGTDLLCLFTFLLRFFPSFETLSQLENALLLKVRYDDETHYAPLLSLILAVSHQTHRLV